MEQDYVTAAFFRHAIAQRQQHIQQLEDMQQIMDGAAPACLSGLMHSIMQLHAHVEQSFECDMKTAPCIVSEIACIKQQRWFAKCPFEANARKDVLTCHV